MRKKLHLFMALVGLYRPRKNISQLLAFYSAVFLVLLTSIAYADTNDPIPPITFFDVASEIRPFGGTGGLAEVVPDYAIGKARMGHHVVIISPHWEDAIDHKEFDIRPAGTIGSTLLFNDVTVPVFSVDMITVLKRRGVISQEEVFPGSIETYFVGRPNAPEGENFLRGKNFYGDYLRNKRMFPFFTRAALDLITRHIEASQDGRPKILVFHDWQTMLAPVYIWWSEFHRKRYERLRAGDVAIATRIHNAVYQGSYDADVHTWRDAELDPNRDYPVLIDRNGKFNYMMAGSSLSHVIVPVSLQYATEIQRAEYGSGLEWLFFARRDHIFGVTNPVGPQWNAMKHPDLLMYFDETNVAEGKEFHKRHILTEDFHLDPDGIFQDPKRGAIRNVDRPLIGNTARLNDHQKGILTHIAAIPRLIELRPDILIQITGDPYLENGQKLEDHPFVQQMRELERRYPNNFKYFPFSGKKQAARLAAWDVLSQPIKYAPDDVDPPKMLSMGGAIIGRNTGGVGQKIVNYDPVTGVGNGVKYDIDSVDAYVNTMVYFLNNFWNNPIHRRQLQMNALRESHTFEARHSEFEAFFRAALERMGDEPPYLKELRKSAPTAPPPDKLVAPAVSPARPAFTSIGDRPIFVDHDNFFLRFPENRRMTSGKRGTLLFHLHAHMPTVLNHADGMNGERWLLEAAFKVYIPLLEVLHEFKGRGLTSALSIDFTPSLVAQLQNPEFGKRFVKFIDDEIARIDMAKAEAGRQNKRQEVELCNWRSANARRVRQLFVQQYESDIMAEFKKLAQEQVIEVTAAFASHAFPNMSTAEMKRVQASEGIRQYKRVFERAPQGMWYPEMGYRPGDEALQAELNVYRFLNTHSVYDRSVANPTSVDPFELPPALFSQPYYIGDSHAVAFIRHPLNVYIWDAIKGYPGHPDFLEHYDSLGIHRITDRDIKDIGKKDLYNPARGTVVAEGAAEDFARRIKSYFARAQAEGIEEPIAAMQFDAELFGHWWFEGPQFIRELLLALNRDPAIALTTPAQYLRRKSPLLSIRPPEGTWGWNFDNTRWLNDTNAYLIQPLRLVSQTTAEISRRYGKSKDPVTQRLVQQINREAMAFTQSDWPFIMSANAGYSEADYAHAMVHKRLSDYLVLLSLLNRKLEDRFGGPEEKTLANIEKRDPTLTDVDLAAWAKPSTEKQGVLRRALTYLTDVRDGFRLKRALRDLDRMMQKTPWQRDPFSTLAARFACKVKLQEIGAGLR